MYISSYTSIHVNEEAKVYARIIFYQQISTTQEIS